MEFVLGQLLDLMCWTRNLRLFHLHPRLCIHLVVLWSLHRNHQILYMLHNLYHMSYRYRYYLLQCHILHRLLLRFHNQHWNTLYNQLCMYLGVHIFHYQVHKNMMDQHHNQRHLDHILNNQYHIILVSCRISKSY